LATATHGLPDSLAAKVEAIIVEGAKGGPLPHVESLAHELEGRVTAAMEVIEAHRSSDKWGTACSSD